TIGIDLVAMCVNDILVMGAEPVFFLDYMASSRMIPEKMKEVLHGIANGCCEAECALLGGETPEMPGFYHDGEYDLAGFAVGIVERKKIINGKGIGAGDVVIGLKSSGLHSNGFSLVRKVLFEKAKLDVNSKLKTINGTIGDELLKPTKIYVKPIRALLRHYRFKKVVKGMAHITGGGLVENIPRVLPEGCSVRIKKGSWPVPAIFEVIQKRGKIEVDEMYNVLNMGIGMVLIVSKYYAPSIMKKLKQLKEDSFIIGKVMKGNRKVEIV
ncbi:MAG: phosphoribosylformylglycinamidine cyclo-ligase, partial [Planctomycetota bacterium]